MSHGCAFASVCTTFLPMLPQSALAILVVGAVAALVAPAVARAEGGRVVDAEAVAASSGTATGSATAAPSGAASDAPGPAPSAPPAFDVDDSGSSLTTTDVVQPMVKTLVALSIVLLLAWLTLHKGMGRLVERAQAGKRMRVVERVALDARRSLFLVEVDGRTLVVGGGDLVRIDVPEATGNGGSADGIARAAAFEKVLASSQPRPSSSTTPAQSSSSSEPA